MKQRTDAFTVLNALLLVGISLITLYPFWHSLVGSLTPYVDYVRSRGLLLWPRNPTFAAYVSVFEQGGILAPLYTSTIATVFGTLASLSFTALTAYALSKEFFGARIVIYFVVMTMFVNAGLIPNYILYRGIGILNTRWVYILPSLVNTFYLIVMRTHFRSFSKELEESARMDGCSELRIFLQIVLPLSKATLATIGLFYAVNNWNILFQSLFFVRDQDKKTLQDYLYQIIRLENAESADSDATADTLIFSETIKLANVMLTALPILMLYPFLQRYFVRGVMVGAIKG